jgi:hypothetical protein
LQWLLLLPFFLSLLERLEVLVVAKAAGNEAHGREGLSKCSCDLHEL